MRGPLDQLCVHLRAPGMKQAVLPTSFLAFFVPSDRITSPDEFCQEIRARAAQGREMKWHVIIQRLCACDHTMIARANLFQLFMFYFL